MTTGAETIAAAIRDGFRELAEAVRSARPPFTDDEARRWALDTAEMREYARSGPDTPGPVPEDPPGAEGAERAILDAAQRIADYWGTTRSDWMGTATEGPVTVEHERQAWKPAIDLANQLIEHYRDITATLAERDRPED